MDETVLRVTGLTKYFAGVHAVEDADLAVSAGERRAILGPNGAGKTTLFNLVAGMMPPTRGRIELFGHDVTRMPAWERTRMGLARTFQTSRVLAGLSVADNLFLAALGPGPGRLRFVRSRADQGIAARARDVAGRIGLASHLATPAGELSHGEKRQLEVGMALAADPRLVLLDEPSAGLARGERQRLTELLLAIDPDVTILIIEHDMEVALRVAQRITVMHRGRILTEGTPDDIRADPRVHEIYLGRFDAA